jgi:hypothetical protein
MNDLSDETKRLIETAIVADGPSEEHLEAIGAELFRKIGAGAVVLSGAKLAAAAAAPAAPVLKAAMSGITAYFLVGLTAGVGVAVTAAALGGFRASSPATKPVAAVPNERAPARPRLLETTGITALAPSTDGMTPGPRPAERAREARTGSELAPSATSSLSAEVESLSKIQAFLAAGDGKSALAASDRYFAESPSGTLRDEHVAARVLALCLLGDVTRARAAARMFVVTSKRSPLLPRLAHSCVADMIGKQ